MKVNFVKQRGGVLIPASQIDEDMMRRFKNNETYQAEIKVPRNPEFHKKVMAFFAFCFNHWSSDREFMDERGQFDVFRKQLTILAGYYDEFYSINGEVRVEAKSISYANMTQEVFEGFYGALIAAAMRHIFHGCGEETESRLISFF